MYLSDAEILMRMHKLEMPYVWLLDGEVVKKYKVLEGKVNGLVLMEVV